LKSEKLQKKEQKRNLPLLLVLARHCHMEHGGGQASGHGDCEKKKEKNSHH
jgi:hypothetical protein